MSVHLLETHGLVKSYGGRTVVDGLSISVGRSEIVGILGPNGAGKTTSFYMIVGIILCDSGNIYFVGYQDSVQNNMGIYFSILDSNEYQMPELLPQMINSRFLDWTPVIARDESYLIFSSNRPGSKDSYGDLYISFRDENGSWTEPMNLGDRVNTNQNLFLINGPIPAIKGALLQFDRRLFSGRGIEGMFITSLIRWQPENLSW